MDSQIVDAKPVEQAIVRQEPQMQALTPAEMLSIAVQQGCDTIKLEKLMQLQERFEANNARKAYAEAIVKFRSACPTIVRTGSANYGQGKTSYTYAQLPDAVEQIQKLMQDCQLAVTWQTPEQTPTWIQVKCTVTHVLGHSESTTLGGPPDTSGSKNQLQAIKSCWSYLRRTTLWSLLGLVDKDEVDDDGAGGKKTAEKKPTPIGAEEDKAAAEFCTVLDAKAGVKFTKDRARASFRQVVGLCGSKSAPVCLEYLKRTDVMVAKDGTVSQQQDGQGGATEDVGTKERTESAPAPAPAAAVPAEAKCKCTAGHEFAGKDVAQCEDGSVCCPECGEFIAEIKPKDPFSPAASQVDGQAQGQVEKQPSGAVMCKYGHAFARDKVLPSPVADPKKGELGCCPICKQQNKIVLVKEG
jgi:hypothetical protein